jgi:hypothetical protein
MGTSDPVRIGYTPGQDITLDHLQDQIEWHDRESGESGHNQPVRPDGLV